MNAGKYAMEVYAYVGKSKKATITVHVPGFVADGWCVFNNFALTELKDNTVDIEAVEMVNGQSVNGKWYDLSGRQIVHRQSSNRPIQKGLYIRDGKKVVLK